MFCIKNIFSLLIATALFLNLSGCVTTFDHGQGTVIAEKKLQSRDYKPREGTKIGAAVGGGVGAAGGGLAGGTAGLGLGALAGATNAALFATTLGGAALGAIIVGSAGALAGGGLGYAVDTLPNDGLYQFIVKPDNAKKSITIVQYSKSIPIHSRVRILERDRSLFIKK